MSDAAMLPAHDPRRRRLLGHGGAAALTALLAPSLVSAQIKPDTGGLDIEPIDVEARAIEHFEKSRADRARFGKLEFRGGLVLSSANASFGGWSGLCVDGDGRRLLAVSDAGTWLTADLLHDGLRPKGIANARLGPLTGIGGASLKRARDRDAEAVTLVDGSLSKGTLLIAFERNHRIGRYEINEHGLSPALGYLKLLPEARLMKSNRGFEAVAAIRGGPLSGAVIAFAERLIDADGHHTGWLWQRGEPQRLALRDIGEFDVTDVAALGGGGLVILERRFRWLEGIRMRLRRLDAAAIRAGAVLDGEILLEADLTFEIDNMEGLAAHRGRRGETVLTLVSDDNFNALLQRTVLLQFVLPDEDLASTKGRP